MMMSFITLKNFNIYGAKLNLFWTSNCKHWKLKCT